MIDLAQWHSFYAIVGAAAGALIGLQFVVVALVAERPALRTAQAGAAFATPNIVHFRSFAFISASAHSMANHHHHCSSLGPDGFRWRSVCSDRSLAPAGPSRIQNGARGLVVSCRAAFGGTCNACVVGIGGPLVHTRSPVWSRRGDAAVTLRRHS